MVRSSLFLISLAALISSPAAAEIGRIKSSVGSASIERGSNHIPAAIGQELMPGDWLVTGKDGRMSLTFVDNTRFAVGPNSRIALSKFEYDKTKQNGSFVTKVERGSLAVVSGRIAKSGRDAMQVSTPESLLGVRGTRFIVEVRP
ncbi:FecR family protein [Sphingomonas hankyongi]|uniref:FecR domain-containing protein n=1 Tax=Sphingomonas hankyongi TaxID=2908209 RepID=A0ABT0S279_9SPHN|nr:FecR domain-containing protein [Sphingomonas hankyongi]MCL6729665.1 FecR domain-containing protein [Sphingomonas hankyongi]